MSAPLEILPLAPACMGELAALFEDRGGPRHCWCRVWRAPLAGMNEGPSPTRRAIRKAGLAAEVAAGVHAGLLARAGGTGGAGGAPVGWCSCGPRESFPRLGTPVKAPGAMWSVVCFYVPAARRGQGIGRALLAAAVAAARAAGAAALEATPVDPESPSYRFMGFVASFAAAGFRPAGPIGRRRHRMILDLGRDAGG
ncbi:MAG: GNAT family N-acetyltransferase [Rhodobacteraceae bacterium]|nr:GNAT family N-acetyltransferase [Paracoccaceae bacterium]